LGISTDLTADEQFPLDGNVVGRDPLDILFRVEPP
jgi:hypothetical protein